ncbi:hypothetical protein HK098_002702, partial [Nowakowskiella sp. JEL0407]
MADSDKVAIKVLANDTSENAQLKIKQGLFSIPLSVVMITLTVGIFSLAIIPTCVIVFGAAQTAADDLSTTIINSVVINLSAQILEIFISVKRANDFLLNAAPMRDLMLTMSDNYGQNQYEESYAAKVSYDNSPYTQRMMCLQKFNLTGKAPPLQNGLHILNAVGYLKDNSNRLQNLWCDYSNTTSCYSGLYDFSQRKISEFTNIPEKGLRPILEMGFIYQKINMCGTNGTWLPESVFGVGWFSYARCAEPINGSSLYVCGSAFDTQKIPLAFQKVAPTTESRLVLVGMTGNVIATNLNANDYPTIKNNAFVSTKEFDDSVVREISQRLSPKGDWSEVLAMSIDANSMKVTNSSRIQREFTLSDGRKWMTIVSRVQFETPEIFYLVVAIPRTDFFGLVDGSIQKGISFSTVFSIVGVLVGLSIAAGILLPLRKLKKNIESVTEFDFSMLSSGGLDENSVFSEVKAVQQTFNIMVKALVAKLEGQDFVQWRSGCSTVVNSNDGETQDLRKHEFDDTELPNSKRPRRVLEPLTNYENNIITHKTESSITDTKTDYRPPLRNAKNDENTPETVRACMGTSIRSVMLDEPHHGKSDSAMDIYSTKLYTFGFIAELLKALPEGNVRQVVTDTVSLQVSPMDGWAYFRIFKELNLVENARCFIRTVFRDILGTDRKAVQLVETMQEGSRGEDVKIGNNFAISMDETMKHVFEQVFSSKQLTSHYCLLAQLTFLLGMQCKSTNPNEVRQIFTHHFAHLFARKNVSLMTDGTENDAADKWIANSSFSAPEEDILLYFFLTGGKGYPALWDQDGQKVPYRFKNTNQRSNDGMEYEAMLSVVICVASHEGGFAGTPLRIFLAEMLYNFRKDRPLHLITFIDKNYTKFFEPIDDLIILFLSPPNIKWPKFAREISDFNLHNLIRPKNTEEVDLRAGPSFAGESKDWEGGLTTEVLKNI